MTRIHTGDCLAVMPTLERNSADACITDPPYGLKFMGKAWDSFSPGDIAMRRNPAMDAVNTGMSRQGGRQRACADYQKRQRRDMQAFQSWCQEWALEIFDVLKPGAYLLAFGGTRTYHRLTCAIEDAGFEIHDCLSWLYGSGFPKHASKLKPAWEPIVMARKPAPKATALNINPCRLETPDDTSRGARGIGGICYAQDEWTKNPENHRASETHPLGRWPANVALDEVAARALDEMTGERGGHDPRALGDGRRPGGFANIGALRGTDRPNAPCYDDAGGASRFFYTAKASRSEREEGLEYWPLRKCGTMEDDAYAWDRETERGRQPRDAQRANHHPTVKPVDLMRWLVRLVTPPNGVVLDPFAGSGSTGVAAVLEDRRFIGIEREPEYVAIANARIGRASEQGSLFRELDEATA